jgi:hypothetical protein
MRHLLLLLLGALAAPATVEATHARGGEIRYTFVGPVPGGDLYEIAVHLYLDPLAPTDRPEVILHIGNEVDTVARTAIIPLPGACPSTQLCIHPRQCVFAGFGIRAWRQCARPPVYL